MQTLLRIGLLGAFCLALTAHLGAQVEVYYDDNNPALGTTNTIPFAQSAGYTTIHIYRAADLHKAGVAPGAVLADFAIVPTITGTYNAPTAKLQIGHLLDTTAYPTNWNTSLDNPVTAWDTTFGPFTFAYTANTWTSLPGVLTAGFVWDGVRDVGVYYSSSSGTTGGFSIRRSALQGRLGVTAAFATTQTPTTTGLFAMKARLTWTGQPVQQNTPEATLLMDGQTGARYYMGGDTLNFSVSSTTAANNPFYMLVSPNLTGGHLPLTGQSIDVGSIFYGFNDVFLLTPGGVVPALSGLGGPFDFLDPAGNYTFNFNLPRGFSIPRQYFQALIFDPTHPNNIRATGLPSFDVEGNSRYSLGLTSAVAIADVSTQTFTFNLPAGTTVNDVDLLLQTSHPNYTDWVITLAHGATTVTLKNSATVDNTDIVGTYRLTDEAPMTFDQAALFSGTAILDGRYGPTNALSAFDGVDQGGAWTLTIQDAVSTNAGSLINASLIINGSL